MITSIPASRIVTQDIWLPTQICDPVSSAHERGIQILIVTLPISLLIVGVILPLLYLHLRSNKTQTSYCQLCSSVGDRGANFSTSNPTSSFEFDEDRENKATDSTSLKEDIMINAME
ncbi:uncharacterized protein MELLADRAFT_103398 [Melampsora larici-populina 98AG31]|uniref:Uncharacterized protein n=1 Tax=Melampsora larici-populina (strain 98AG31 / pathotype 3-4-7) TaxID=747676 RepID=F4RBC3_MELLP|nr:uncharacterized protein MELLADRAFT_103398 [Melampsora larici-populina 98AG31]EGG10385.1 hypothetical protein MELLADRAFT_103398 [Melampsora larici-populina 98AG31]